MVSAMEKDPEEPPKKRAKRGRKSKSSDESEPQESQEPQEPDEVPTDDEDQDQDTSVDKNLDTIQAIKSLEATVVEALNAFKEAIAIVKDASTQGETKTANTQPTPQRIAKVTQRANAYPTGVFYIDADGKPLSRHSQRGLFQGLEVSQ